MRADAASTASLETWKSLWIETPLCVAPGSEVFVNQAADAPSLSTGRSLSPVGAPAGDDPQGNSSASRKRGSVPPRAIWSVKKAQRSQGRGAVTRPQPTSQI